jgi:protein gp37
MRLPWAQSLKDQCVAAGVPFFFKRNSQGNHELDGRTWEEFPTDSIPQETTGMVQMRGRVF